MGEKKVPIKNYSHRMTKEKTREMSDIFFAASDAGSTNDFVRNELSVAVPLGNDILNQVVPSNDLNINNEDL